MRLRLGPLYLMTNKLPETDERPTDVSDLDDLARIFNNPKLTRLLFEEYLKEGMTRRIPNLQSLRDAIATGDPALFSQPARGDDESDEMGDFLRDRELWPDKACIRSELIQLLNKLLGDLPAPQREAIGHFLSGRELSKEGKRALSAGLFLLELKLKSRGIFGADALLPADR